MRSLFLSLILVGMSGAQAPVGAQEPVGPTTEVRSTTVLVDVVVRDRRGMPIPNLRASDFEVYEDGVLQDINHFESYAEEGHEPEGAAGPMSASAEPTGGRTPSVAPARFTALLFDRLSPNARSFARKASLAYLSDATGEADRVGIFFADLSLRTLLPYTEDHVRVQDAIKRALGGTSSRQGAVSADAATGTPGAATTQDPGDLSLGGLSGVGGAQSQADSGLGGMSARMSSMAQRISADRQGYATTNSLLAVVKSLESIPGRKTILYFSEGISIPPAVEARFRSVIDSANRSNVSIYAIDAAGLRIESTGAFGGNQIASASTRGGTWMATNSESANGESLLQDVLERNETALRGDAHGSMNRLADETGGVLIRESNDIEEGMQEIGQDMRNYYILGYTPKNSEMDGSYRQIEVKTTRKDARVRFRKGYYAVDRTTGQPLRDFEKPVLALLAKPDATGPLPVKLAVLSFPKPEDPGFVALLGQVPPGTLSYESTDSGRALSDFALVAVVRDGEGNVVDKVSQHYRLPAPDPSGPPKDGILFYRELHLPDGQFRVELAGYDALKHQAGFDRAGLVLQEPDPTLPRLSSIVLVGSAETVGQQDMRAATPFHYGDILLYPNLDDRFSKAASDQMTFFFTVYPADADPTEAIVELRRFGKTVDRMRVSLPKPDDEGRIQLASSLPVKKYETGTYTLVVAIPAGQQVVARSCRFLLMQ